MLNVTDLRASFDTDGWALGYRCIPVLHHATGDPVENFTLHCTGRVLYRFFGYDGRLLYVGVTKDLHARCGHRPGSHGMKFWWKQVAFITVESSFSSRRELEEAETAVIRAEDPFHNVAGTAGSAYRRNGWPGAELARTSPAIFKLADALWWLYLDEEPRRQIDRMVRSPLEAPSLQDGEGLSDHWAYRQPITRIGAG